MCRGAEERCMSYVGEMESMPVNLNGDLQIKISGNRRRVNAKEEPEEEEHELVMVAKVFKSNNFSEKGNLREMDDMHLQRKTKIWLSEVLRVIFKDEASVADLLDDGELLFNLSKVVRNKVMKLPAGSMNPKVMVYERTSSVRNNERYMAYTKIDSFLNICKIIGVRSIELFSPSDVVEKRNTRGVCLCLRRLSKKARLRDLDIPDFDTVTYTIPMPKDMVRFLYRNLKRPQIRRHSFDPVGLLVRSIHKQQSSEDGDGYLEEIKIMQSCEIDAAPNSGSSDGTGSSSSLSLSRTGWAESILLENNVDGNEIKCGRKLRKCPSSESIFCPSSRSVSTSIYHLRPRTSPSVCHGCLKMQSFENSPGLGNSLRRYLSSAKLNQEIKLEDLRRDFQRKRKVVIPGMGNDLEYQQPSSISPPLPSSSMKSEDCESRFSDHGFPKSSPTTKTVDDFEDIRLLFNVSHFLEQSYLNDLHNFSQIPMLPEDGLLQRDWPEYFLGSDSCNHCYDDAKQQTTTMFESSTLDSSYGNCGSIRESAVESSEEDFAPEHADEYVEMCEMGGEVEAEAPIMAEEKTGDPQEKQPNGNIFLKIIANGVLLAGGIFFALQFSGFTAAIKRPQERKEHTMESARRKPYVKFCSYIYRKCTGYGYCTREA